MRYLVLIAGIALAGTAFAGDTTDSASRELDKSSPMLISNADSSNPGDSSASGGTRAQDYNSSRSNNSSALADKSGDLDRDGRLDVASCAPGADDDCNDTERAASPSNHNTTRSNRTRAENFNSTRSNKTEPRRNADDDDSDLTEVRCSLSTEDCVSNAAGGDGNDLVLRKRPGKK